MQISRRRAGKKPIAEVTGRFVLHSFLDDQMSLALPLGRVALNSGAARRQIGGALSREPPAGTELTVVVTTRGVHVLDVKLPLPVEQTGAAGKLTLPSKPVAAGLAPIHLAGTTT